MNNKAVRKKLNMYAVLYGTLDERTLKVSQEMDELVNAEMRKMKGGKDK